VGFVADSGDGPAKSQGEKFSSYADALRHLEEVFDKPLIGRRS